MRTPLWTAASAGASTLALALALAQGGGAAAQNVKLAPEEIAPPNALTDLLFWPQAKRDANFRQMEKLTPTHTVRRGAKVKLLPKGTPLPALAWTHNGAAQTLESYMASERTSGVMVLQDGKVRLERYGLGYRPNGRWTSFSVAKSFTSTLAGAAIRDGYIKSVEDPITAYLPELKGSAYDGVNVRQLLTMTSGVKWNEDYTDPNSDVVAAGHVKPPAGQDPVLYFMAKLPREAAPGTKWVYKTGETNLIGVLVKRAVGKPLADYLSEKVWKPVGMAQDAAWITAENGQEFGGFGLSVSLGDYARFGQFVLEGGQGVVAPGWYQAAGTKQAEIGQPGYGYGYQWWTRDDGAFDGRGIFGQMIHIDAKRKLVVVINSDWPTAVGPELSRARADFLKAIDTALDGERGG